MLNLRKRLSTSFKQSLALFRRKSFDIIVPFYNSAAYLDIVLGYYKQVRCLPICVIDCKSDDKTEQIARSLSKSVLLNESKSLSIEEMIAEMTMHAKSKWVLRLDDDELPSKALLRYAQKVTTIDHGDAHGFIRYQCAIRNDGFLMRHIDHCPYSHRQWR